MNQRIVNGMKAIQVREWLQDGVGVVKLQTPADPLMSIEANRHAVLCRSEEDVKTAILCTQQVGELARWLLEHTAGPSVSAERPEGEGAVGLAIRLLSKHCATESTANELWPTKQNEVATGEA